MIPLRFKVHKFKPGWGFFQTIKVQEWFRALGLYHYQWLCYLSLSLGLLKEHFSLIMILCQHPSVPYSKHSSIVICFVPPSSWPYCLPTTFGSLKRVNVHKPFIIISMYKEQIYLRDSSRKAVYLIFNMTSLWWLVRL